MTTDGMLYLASARYNAARLRLADVAIALGVAVVRLEDTEQLEAEFIRAHEAADAALGLVIEALR